MKLIDIAFSAWSEKARWALDWKGLAYTREEYLPVIGDIDLARRTGQAEVPVLFTAAGEAIPDSTRIVLYLERAAPEPALLPAEPRERADALRWQDWASETLSPVGRALVTAAISADAEAAQATVPPGTPGFVRRASRVVVPLGLRVFRWQYELGATAFARAKERLPLLLETIEASLGGGRMFLVGESFSIADLAVASALLLVEPPADEYLPRPMPPVLRRAYTYAPARRDFGGVFAWRDELYRRYRKGAPKLVKA
jgi:glutathione S-transferase